MYIRNDCRSLFTSIRPARHLQTLEPAQLAGSDIVRLICPEMAHVPLYTRR